MNASFTPGPWSLERENDDSNFYHSVYGADEGGDGGLLIARCNQSGKHPADTHLIAAAPDLLNGCNALLGLIQLLAANSDTPPELLRILTENHRIAEAEAAVAKARGEQVPA